MTYTWKDEKYRFLKLNYMLYYLRWYGVYNDDRAIYCNLYCQIIDAIESVVDNPAPLARVGLNNAIRHNTDVMDRIITKFKEVDHEQSKT